MMATILSCVAFASLGLSAFALPQILPKGANDFSLDGHYALPTVRRLDRRDGQFYGYGPVSSFTVGGQTLTGLIDAGAGYLTTRNISQITSGDNGGYYAISKSPTVHPIAGASWSQCFNTGCFGGPVVKDDMTIGSGSTTIKGSQVLVMACDKSCVGGGSNFGFGRGLTTQYTQNGKTVTGPSWFASISSSLTQRLWTLYLDGGTGLFNFGYLDSKYYSGNIGYAAIDTTGNWQTSVTGYSFSNGGPSSTTQVLKFALDTGDSEMGLPPSIVKAYFAAVSGAKSDSSGNYHYPCTSTLPNFTITVGGVKVTVAGSNFKGGNVDSTTCWSSLVEGGDFGSVSTWGLPFLQGVFTVFSYGTDDNSDRLGFANKPAGKP